MSTPNLRGIVESPEWMAAAACRESDPEIFYPSTGRSSRDGRAVCGRCPVQAACLVYAIEHREHYGVWGGLSERQRRRLRETGGRSVNGTGTDARQSSPRGPDKREGQVRELAATLSDSQIAARLGCCRQTVLSIRAAAGIPPARARHGGTGRARAGDIRGVDDLMAFIAGGGPEGRTRNEITRVHFRKHQTADGITAMISILVKDGRVRQATGKSSGNGCRPTTLYLATSHDRTEVAS